VLGLRFLVLSGKGGVGRTTVAAALARAASRRGKRVLVAQTDAVERLGKLLGRPGPIGPKVITAAPGIDAVNMTPKESLHEYALMVLRYETLYRALFENRAMRGFLGAVPGLDAYAMLGKAWWHTTERAAAAAEGADGLKYDLVILDGPASGHCTSMLRIPQAIIDRAPVGPLARDARALRELLSDPARAALMIVTLPEELPARETAELARAARGPLAIPLAPVVVNAVPPARLSSGAAGAVLDRLPDDTGDGGLDATLRMAANVRTHRQAAEEALARLRADPALPLVELPWLPTVGLGPREIDTLAAALERAPAPA
jgi:anion-transporting  ArsA/GET3 family ATPase